MFWSGKFGFASSSTLETLLDKPADEISLEAVLDEDELLQECKAQNSKLVDYFKREAVLRRLFDYVTGNVVSEGTGRYKYPHVATEVLCSDIWSIVEACVASPQRLLVDFWDTVLNRTPEDMKTQVGMAASFSKINAVFLNKKPLELYAFLQAQPNIIQRTLIHLETPAFVDLLVRIMQLDESSECENVLEWLSSQGMMSRLVETLSPNYSETMHSVVAEVIKGVVSMATPSPGAGITDHQGGPASNLFARELAHEDNITKVIGYVMMDFSLNPSEDGDSLPNFESSVSSTVHSIAVIIELIRKNNSDYFEPYLFHTLRNKLIQVQQTLQPGDGRDSLELAMKEMVDRMGVVHLGPLLEQICSKMDILQKYLSKPRSLTGKITTTTGDINPLTFERYRIAEMYAELLHCSNMSLLNRSSEFNHLYDNGGRLQGGLHAMEELARVIAVGAGKQANAEDLNEDDIDEIEPALELPVSSASHGSPSLLDSDDEVDSDEPGEMEDISIHEDLTLSTSPIPLRASPAPEDTSVSATPTPESSLGSLKRKSTSTSRRNSRRTSVVEQLREPGPTIGDRLKSCFLELGVLKTLLDLFFDFEFNNFLHSVVYDLIHQILTGRVDGGLNRELVIALFKDAKITQRILEAQELNQDRISKPKGVRLGYMGHLTLITEDLVNALNHYPSDLLETIQTHIPLSKWEEYLSGEFAETKAKDTQLLGGGKPIVGAAARGQGAARWKVDEEDAAGTVPSELSNDVDAIGDLKGEFRRVGSQSTSVGGGGGGADFGPPSTPPKSDSEDSDQEAEERAAQMTRYAIQDALEHSIEGHSSDEDEEESSGWLAQSTRIRHSRGARGPLETDDSGFTVSRDKTNMKMKDLNDVQETFDDDFGAFTEGTSSTVGAENSDPFMFPTSFSSDTTRISSNEFEGFGDDFGGFQSGGDSSHEDMTGSSNSWSSALSTGSTASEGEWSVTSDTTTSESPREGH